MRSKPFVFVIESLKFDDEKKKRFEGEIISQILRLSGSKVKYVRLRTRQELEEILDQFQDSKYRYIHFSCHGDSKGIQLTLNYLRFVDLKGLLAPYLENRRVFFSSCQVANEKLAKALLKNSGCHSVIGPSRNITFDRAAIFWASFYHLMLRDEAEFMKQSKIKETTKSLQDIFDVHMRYFTKSNVPRGFDEVDLSII